MADKLSGSMQENLLTLLCYSQRTSFLIRNAVEVELFASPLYREIIGRVYDYLDQFKKPPGDHISDLLEDILTAKDKEAELCARLIEAVHAQHEGVNEDYVISQLEKFIRRQRLRSSLIAASELSQEGQDEEAEVLLERGLRQRLQLFSPGITLTQGLKLAYAGTVRRDVIMTGIKELDAWHLGPGRGELHILIGPAKRGKSWWLVNTLKRALLQRLKVAYITLELSEGQIISRAIQSIFSMQKHQARVDVSRITADELGRFTRFDRKELKGRNAFSDKSTKKKVEQKLESMHFRDNVLVKEFPTGMLTVDGLRAYLDALERAHNFIPDVVLLDYPDLMKIDTKNYRLDLGVLYRELRGIAVERNIIMATVSQSNREGAGSKLVTDTHAAEDWSKIGTADTIFTYTQTLAEKELGLARLFVSNTRVAEKDRFVVLMSQAYQIGQFCLDSALMTDNYWNAIKEAKGDVPEDE